MDWRYRSNLPQDRPEPTRAQWDAFHKRMEKHMATEDEFSNEDLKKYEISNADENTVELRHDGRILMHCDEHMIWYLHVGDKLVPLDELMGNLALIKRVMNELADNARMTNG